ncbi:hypothetical protein HETIRDRAFT_66494 [Heterobasidion irregulare TC 32-1]|uniref:Uncharacterized protein n=1 Tax=Heterobasidion irregulare (strain TC 32-1) TaxID=747525 RepID=W4JTC9_HETIT|nr:uncharacterized protein HETIRDRAFT_66494 [Heterobasidion irregulare TC 32-1]ETW76156.1 hypothetical protein HETIRDRAFT_66494 [Heterobasidion irregulare TC 32-1]
MRLYAMWKNNKYIVALLISLIAVESTVIGVVFGMTTKTVATNNPAQGVFICADGDKPGRPWATFYYTSILVTELAFLGLSLLRAWYDHRFGTGGRLMRILTRDSVYYFAVIFWIYLANQIIWCINILTLNEVATGFSFSVSTILANRLMISIRKLYYTKIEGSALHSIPSRDHSNFEVATTGPHYEGYELQTFQERTARSECSGHAIYLYELMFA